MSQFPSLPRTTVEALLALAAALGCIVALAAFHSLPGETAAQMAVSLVYGALAAWNRGAVPSLPPPGDGQ